MNTNEKYFNRVRGTWNWLATFQLLSLTGLLKSSIRWDHKIRAIGLILNQIVFGPFSMQSEVDLIESSKQVLHLLKLTKWGMVFYISNKRIALDSNGSDLLLEGEEYFWPFLNSPQSFKNFKARVDDNITSAKYEWPLFGACVQCETLLGNDQGRILLDAGWLRCTFQLTSTSLEELKRRG